MNDPIFHANNKLWLTWLVICDFIDWYFSPANCWKNWISHLSQLTICFESHKNSQVVHQLFNLMFQLIKKFSKVQFSISSVCEVENLGSHWRCIVFLFSVTSCVWLCNTMNWSTPGFSKLIPFSPWCLPTVTYSAAPFSSCSQTFPESGSVPMSWLFTSDSQSIGVSASASSFQWIGLISLLSKGLSRIFSSTTVRKY